MSKDKKNNAERTKRANIIVSLHPDWSSQKVLQEVDRTFAREQPDSTLVRRKVTKGDYTIS